MDILKRNGLKTLIETPEKWCVSLYMPTHRLGRQQQQDPIRFKNFLTQAQNELLALDFRGPEIQDFLQPLENLLVDSYFWQHQSDGLAVFLSKNFFRTYRLPLKFDELLVISKSFHVKPLIPLLSQDGQFYLLAISMNEIRLFQGTRDTMDEVDLEDIPSNMQEALQLNDPEKHLGFHTSASSPGRAGLRRAAFHGHGSKSTERKKSGLLRYFQNVDQGLKQLLEDQTIPMVLVGVDYLLPIYQQANTYAGLLDEGLEGNPEQVSEVDLHHSAWELVNPIFNQAQNEAIERYEELAGMGNHIALNDLQEVVKASVYGQVDILFVALGIQRWGVFKTQENKVTIHQELQPGDVDLLDLAAMHTMINGGTVYARPTTNFPGQKEVAAILRYGH